MINHINISQNNNIYSMRTKTHRMSYKNTQMQKIQRNNNGQNGVQNKLQSAKHLKLKRDTF